MTKYSFADAGLDAEHGETRTKSISVCLAGQSVHIPVTLINGAMAGPSVTLTAGIHGSEYPGIVALSRLIEDLDPNNLRGCLAVLPIANPTAFFDRRIYTNAEDGMNLNRQFPGKQDGTYTDQLAAWLFDHFISPADAYIDLHSGDAIEELIAFCSYVESGRVDQDAIARRIAESVDVEYLLAWPANSGNPGTAHATAAACGVPAVLVEVGGLGVWHESDVATMTRSVMNALAILEVVDTPVEKRTSTTTLSDWNWYRAEQEGLLFTDVRAGDRVRAGQRLALINDPLGACIQQIHADQDGIVMFRVATLAVNKGDPVAAIAYGP